MPVPSDGIPAESARAKHAAGSTTLSSIIAKLLGVCLVDSIYNSLIARAQARNVDQAVVSFLLRPRKPDQNTRISPYESSASKHERRSQYGISIKPYVYLRIQLRWRYDLRK